MMFPFNIHYTYDEDIVIPRYIYPTGYEGRLGQYNTHSIHRVPTTSSVTDETADNLDRAFRLGATILRIVVTSFKLQVLLPNVRVGQLEIPKDPEIVTVKATISPVDYIAAAITSGIIVLTTNNTILLIISIVEGRSSVMSVTKLPLPQG